MPMPAPTPRIAESRPMLPATLSRGNSSRTIPNASGKIPPLAPWMKRPSISGPSEEESAASRVPAASTTSVHTSVRSLPYMSPSRPMMAVPTDAASRYAVSSQVISVSVVPSACWMVGSAGTTAELSIAYASPPSASTARIRFGCVRSLSALITGLGPWAGRARRYIYRSGARRPCQSAVPCAGRPGNGFISCSYAARRACLAEGWMLRA